MDFVDFLLGNEAGLFVRYVEHARIGQMGHIVSRFGAIQVVARGNNIRIRCLDRSRGSCHVILHLGNFQFGEYLAGSYAVSYIYVDDADVARNFGHHVDLLVGNEFRGHIEIVRYISALRFCDWDDGNGYGLRVISASGLITGA